MKKFQLLTLLVTMTLLSCQKNNQFSELKVAGNEGMIENLELSESVDKPENTSKQDRKLIKTGTVEFETDSVSKTTKHIMEVVRKYNGYISSNTDSNYGSFTRKVMQIRIPANHFNDLLNKIGKDATKMISKSIQVRDVTEQFIDVEARLKNKKAFEQRYIELLKKTHKINEILAIEHQIEQLRSDIEAAEGKFRYLKNQIGFSTLELIYYKKQAPQPSENKFVRAIKNGWENIIGFLYVMLSIWPFILLTIGGVIIYKKLKRRK